MMTIKNKIVFTHKFSNRLMFYVFSCSLHISQCSDYKPCWSIPDHCLHYHHCGCKEKVTIDDISTGGDFQTNL